MSKKTRQLFKEFRAKWCLVLQFSNSSLFVVILISNLRFMKMNNWKINTFFNLHLHIYQQLKKKVFLHCILKGTTYTTFRIILLTLPVFLVLSPSSESMWPSHPLHPLPSLTSCPLSLPQHLIYQHLLLMQSLSPPRYMPRPSQSDRSDSISKTSHMLHLDPVHPGHCHRAALQFNPFYIQHLSLNQQNNLVKTFPRKVWCVMTPTQAVGTPQSFFLFLISDMCNLWKIKHSAQCY